MFKLTTIILQQAHSSLPYGGECIRNTSITSHSPIVAGRLDGFNTSKTLVLHKHSTSVISCNCIMVLAALFFAALFSRFFKCRKHVINPSGDNDEL